MLIHSHKYWAPVIWKTQLQVLGIQEQGKHRASSLQESQSLWAASRDHGVQGERKRHTIVTFLRSGALLGALNRLSHLILPHNSAKWVFPPHLIHTQRINNFRKSTGQEQDLNLSLADSQPTRFTLLHDPSRQKKSLFCLEIMKIFKLIIAFVFHANLVWLAGKVLFPFCFPWGWASERLSTDLQALGRSGGA